MNPEDVIFTECARCGKFAVHPDEWVDLCPSCIFFQNLSPVDPEQSPSGYTHFMFEDEYPDLDEIPDDLD